VDVGGTFTDLVALGEGRVVTAKVPSTPRDQSVGVMNTVAASEVEAGAVTALAHGMTVTTNALLECRGARTALVTTEGFRDVLEIARQNRTSFYDLTRNRPPSLVPRELLPLAGRVHPSPPRAAHLTPPYLVLRDRNNATSGILPPARWRRTKASALTARPVARIRRGINGEICKGLLWPFASPTWWVWP
jgi:hypothetical protein